MDQINQYELKKKLRMDVHACMWMTSDCLKQTVDKSAADIYSIAWFQQALFNDKPDKHTQFQDSTLTYAA